MKKIFISGMLLLAFTGIFLNLREDTLPTLNKPAESKINTIIPDTSSAKARVFFEEAKKQIGVVKTYDFSNRYYGNNNGYPPADTGVCSDVIARAFDITESNLRKLVDTDIRANPNIYDTNFDTYINFRRVKNLDIFFSRKAKNLTNEMIPGDRENLSEWQTGDIVTFEKLPGKGLWHIGIISDERRVDGVPYMIDNHGYGTDIRITPLDWPAKIIGHYRYF